MPLVLHLCQRAVILQPARAERTLYGRLFHPGQAGIHIQSGSLRLLARQFCTKADGSCQLLCLLFQSLLLGLQSLLQGLPALEHLFDGRQRQVQHPQHPDELEGTDIPCGVIAVVIALSACRCKKPFFFVKADVRGGHAALL